MNAICVSLSTAADGNFSNKLDLYAENQVIYLTILISTLSRGKIIYIWLWYNKIYVTTNLGKRTPGDNERKSIINFIFHFYQHYSEYLI